MNIGQLKISPAPTWKFYDFGNFILGRPAGNIGSLQITTAFRHDAPHDASTADCLALVHEYTSRPSRSEPFDTTESTQPDMLFGGFSFTRDRDFGRVWY